MQVLNELSKEEQEIIELHLQKKEKEINGWKQKRFIYVAISIFYIALGFYWLFAFVQLVKNLKNENTIVEYLKQEEKPDDMPTEYWCVAEIRRTAGILEARNNIRCFQVFEGFLGLIVFGGGICILIKTRRQWLNNYRDAIIIKILRANWDEWKKDSRNENSIESS
jgi:hypothetical protein